MKLIHYCIDFRSITCRNNHIFQNALLFLQSLHSERKISFIE